MKLTRQTRFLAWAGAAVVLAVAGYFVGGALRPAEEPYYVFDTDAPAFQAPSSVAATSQGGFTGFGESGAGEARVVVSGRVVELTEESMTLEGSFGQITTLNFSGAPPVQRLNEATADDLREGLTVAVRLDEAGDTVEGVLILSLP